MYKFGFSKFALVGFLFLSSCKFGTLEKMTDAAGIKVEALSSEGNYYCVDKFLTNLDVDIESKKKSKRVAAYQALKANIKKIVIAPDEIVNTITGVRSNLYHVERICYQSGNCYYLENAKKLLDDSISESGRKPVNAIKKLGDTLFIKIEAVNDLSVLKKYYTKHVSTYDQVESLDQAITSAYVWNEPVENRDQMNCGKFLSLNELMDIVKSL